jgi:putative ABC transport system substrate-binding protein
MPTSSYQHWHAYQQIKDQGIEAMLILDDNTMSAAMSSLIALSLPDSIPIIGKAVEDVQKGALASISVNYDDMSKSTGDLVAAVLLGVEPDDVPVQLFNTDVIAINTDTASKIGYTFPADVLAEAKYIFP